MPDREWLKLKYSKSTSEAMEDARRSWAELTTMQHEAADSARYEAGRFARAGMRQPGKGTSPQFLIASDLKAQRSADEEPSAEALEALKNRFKK